MTEAMCVWIDDIQVQDMRCYHQQSWKIKPGVNIFMGENGCGKTTILEAVYMMAYGRSFRQARDPELVRWDAKNMLIRGTWQRYGPLHVQVLGKRRKSEFFLQGRKLNKRKELTDTLSVVVDAPQGARLIDGVNNDRRKWLDQLLMACEPWVKQHYQGYLRALMQRSRLLRKYGSIDELSAWEAQMVLHGRKIKQSKDKFCDDLNEHLKQQQGLTETLLRLDISSNVPEEDQAWLHTLEEKRSQDQRMGRCLCGPHADKINILFAEKEIRLVGSRGQQKLAAIAVKLAECRLRQHYKQLWPVLLLDDCFEALDGKRRLHLIQWLCEYAGQVLLTAPNGVDIESHPSVHIWQVMQRNEEKKKIHSMISHDTMEKIA